MNFLIISPARIRELAEEENVGRGVLWCPPHRGPRRLPRLDPSCLLKVVFYSPYSILHLGTADSADSTLHFGIAYRVDSHDTTYRVYSHDTSYRADSLDAAYTLRTSFHPFRGISLF